MDDQSGASCECVCAASNLACNLSEDEETEYIWEETIPFCPESLLNWEKEQEKDHDEPAVLDSPEDSSILPIDCKQEAANEGSYGTFRENVKTDGRAVPTVPGGVPGRKPAALPSTKTTTTTRRDVNAKRRTEKVQWRPPGVSAVKSVRTPSPAVKTTRAPSPAVKSVKAPSPAVKSFKAPSLVQAASTPVRPTSFPGKTAVKTTATTVRNPTNTVKRTPTPTSGVKMPTTGFKTSSTTVRTPITSVRTSTTGVRMTGTEKTTCDGAKPAFSGIRRTTTGVVTTSSGLTVASSGVRLPSGAGARAAVPGRNANVCPSEPAVGAGDCTRRPFRAPAATARGRGRGRAVPEPVRPGSKVAVPIRPLKYSAAAVETDDVKKES